MTNQVKIFILVYFNIWFEKSCVLIFILM